MSIIHTEHGSVIADKKFIPCVSMKLSVSYRDRDLSWKRTAATLKPFDLQPSIILYVTVTVARVVSKILSPLYLFEEIFQKNPLHSFMKSLLVISGTGFFFFFNRLWTPRKYESRSNANIKSIQEQQGQIGTRQFLHSVNG